MPKPRLNDEVREVGEQGILLLEARKAKVGGPGMVPVPLEHSKTPKSWSFSTKIALIMVVI